MQINLIALAIRVNDATRSCSELEYRDPEVIYTGDNSREREHSQGTKLLVQLIVVTGGGS